MMSKIYAFLFALALGLGTTVTQAAVLDFEDLASPGSGMVALESYSADGFVITSNTGLADSFGYMQTGASLYTGSTGLFNAYFDTLTVLVREDGGAFNLLSLDLAHLFAETGAPGLVIFTGNLVGGGTVDQQVWVTGGATAQTFALGFENVLSVSWAHGDSVFQFDNIELTDASPIPVPEPAPLLLLGLGLLSLLAGRRRKAV